MKKIIALILSLSMTLSLTACGGSPAPSTSSGDTFTSTNTQAKTMKVSIGVPESHFEYVACEKMKEHIETSTNGSIKVELYASNQIGNDQEVFEGLSLGVAQMLPCGSDIIGNFCPEYSLLSLPYLFDDMKGLKIRTMTVPIHLEMFEAMGANPTPMNSSEVFSALQQGVVDGQENPCSNIYSNKYHEVQKYLTLDGHVFTFVTFVCAKDWFESLSEVEQTAIREGVDIATEYMSQACTAEDETALEAMIAEGLQVTELTEEAKDGFRDAVADVRDRNGNAINPEMYQQMMQAIEAAA